MYKAHAAALQAMKAQPGMHIQKIFNACDNHVFFFYARLHCRQYTMYHLFTPHTMYHLFTSGCGHLRIGLVDSYMRWSALPDSGEHAHNVAAVNDHTWANNITREFLVQGTFDWCVLGYRGGCFQCVCFQCDFYSSVFASHVFIASVSVCLLCCVEPPPLIPPQHASFPMSSLPKSHTHPPAWFLSP